MGDRKGNVHKMQRAVVLTDIQRTTGEALDRLPYISVGGPFVNATTSELEKLLRPKQVEKETFIAMDSRRVGLWGVGSPETQRAVELFVADRLSGWLNALWYEV